MKYPEYIEVKGKKYKINTDFRVAIECNKIAEDKNIGKYEKPLAIIYKLYGKEALNDFENHQEIWNLTQRYLSCDTPIVNKNEEIDMDYIQDYGYIWASFMSDYNMDIDKINIHWWKFNELINGLSNSEFGSCCILNRIRNLRNIDTKEIKDQKERQKIIKAKQQVALNKNKKQPTEKQKESALKFLDALGKKRGD